MSNWPSREDLNPKVLEAEYAVRGELAIKAGELATVLKKGMDGFYVQILRDWLMEKSFPLNA